MSFTPNAERRWGIQQRSKVVEGSWYENTLLTSALVGVLTGLVYFNTLSHGFVWDDHTYVLENSQFRSAHHALNFFLSDFCEGVHQECYFYRPLVSLSYLTDFSLWGSNPFGFHLTNVILHILVSLLVYRVGLSLLKNQTAAILCAVLFSVHPIHVESVAFVAARTDTPATLFYLAALLLFIKFRASDPPKGYLFFSASLFCFALSLFSKENAITFPVILTAYLFLFSNPLQNRSEWISRVGPLIPFWVLAVVYLIWRGEILGAFFIGNSLGDGLFHRLWTFPLLFLENILKLVVPWPLEVFRPAPEDLLPWDPMVLGAIPLWVLLLFFVWKVGRKSNSILFGFIWLFVTLLPVMNLIPTPWPSVWDRFLYLPSVGFCLMVGCWGEQVLKWTSSHRGTIGSRGLNGTGILLLILLIGVSVNRNQDWKDNVTFWAVTSQNISLDTWSGAIARNNLGRAYQVRGETLMAVEVWEQVYRAHPSFLAAGINLGNAYASANMYPKAVEVYESLLSEPLFPSQKGSPPDDARSKEISGTRSSRLYYNLGLTYMEMGSLDKAFEVFQRSLSLDPNHYLTHHALGRLFLKMGKHRDAEEAFIETVRLKPDFEEGVQSLGRFYVKQGNLKRAAKVFLNRIERGSENPKIYQNLSWVYLQLGDLSSAVEILEQGLQTTNDASLHYHLGIAYQRLGKPIMAQKEYRKAIGLEPSNPEFYNNLGGVKEFLDDPQGALMAYQKALSLRPDFLTAKINYGRMLAKLERREEALQWFREILRDIPPAFEESQEILYVRNQIDGLANEKGMNEMNPQGKASDGD